MGDVYRHRQLHPGSRYGKTAPVLPPEYKNGNVTRDNKGNAWVHNYTGNVWYVNTSTGDIKPFQFLSSEHLGYIDVERYSIIHDSRDIIWITTYGNGLFAYDLNTGGLQHFTFEVSHSSHINSNYLQYIIEDRSGVSGSVPNFPDYPISKF